MKVLITTTALLLSLLSTDGFLQEFIPKAFTVPVQHANKLIDKIIRPTTDALVGQDLEVRLEVGQKNSAQRMSIQQLLLHLDATEHHPTSAKTSQKNANAKVSTAPPPTGAVAHVIPLTTTGKSDVVHALTVQKTGNFINHAGLQVVGIDTDTAVWELIWDSPDAPAGTLVLGLDVQEDATRNDATLKKGHIFVSFPIWTKGGIAEYQKRKADVEEASSVHLVERDVELQKYKEATNIFAKLWHYRNAAAAVEKYSLYPTRFMSTIPDHADLIPLANGNLFLAKAGTIWRQSASHAFLASNHPVQEGTASIKVNKKAVVPPPVAPMTEPLVLAV